MPKILTVVPGRCNGCQRCVLHCSFHFDKTHKPSGARIYVVRLDPYVYLITPVICKQRGLCMTACPVPGAMERNAETGAVIVTNKCNADKCALECVSACPSGAIFVDLLTKKAMKCDLCDGDPVCVKHCPFHALEYAEPKRAATLRRVETALAMGRRELIAGVKKT